tara:strand:- start:194 stop:460 length:267 start_codon:yes stop_codon:yes gene_type:complete
LAVGLIVFICELLLLVGPIFLGFQLALHPFYLIFEVFFATLSQRGIFVYSYLFLPSSETFIVFYLWKLDILVPYQIIYHRVVQEVILN